MGDVGLGCGVIGPEIRRVENVELLQDVQRLNVGSNELETLEGIEVLRSLQELIASNNRL